MPDRYSSQSCSMTLGDKPVPDQVPLWEGFVTLFVRSIRAGLDCAEPRTGQLQPLGPGSIRQLPHQLLVRVGRNGSAVPRSLITSVTGVSSTSGVTPIKLQSRTRLRSLCGTPRGPHPIGMLTVLQLLLETGSV
jgi:hypothetical protein